MHLLWSVSVVNACFNVLQHGAALLYIPHTSAERKALESTGLFIWLADGNIRSAQKPKSFCDYVWPRGASGTSQLDADCIT